LRRSNPAFLARRESWIASLNARNDVEKAGAPWSRSQAMT
jgi:hypothetical protein